MIGKTISHYRILEKLGQGGMGVVYKAEDIKLKRTVALKFLPPQALGSEKEKTRFMHEAQAAAALNHPNICTIYEIDEVEGKSFIAMEYVEGQSIKEKIESGPLKLDKVLAIAIQIVHGLQEAHEKGIVHRDIKSANIMVTKKGQAKIMDFGLAKLAGRTQLTKTGRAVGTIAYMSPEQAQGEIVDQRTDIWSLGVVIYEMLTGHLPFRGDYEQAVVYSILNEKPEPITDIPRPLEMIIYKTLEKDAADRYQNVDELHISLRQIRGKLKEFSSEFKELKGSLVSAHRWPLKQKKVLYLLLTTVILITTGIILGILRQSRVDENKVLHGVKTEKLSIAVLYFDNNTGKPDLGWLSKGIPDMLITDLGQSKYVQVISLEKLFDILRSLGAERSTIIDRSVAVEIGRRAKAQIMVTGSIIKAGTMFRILAQLNDLRTNLLITTAMVEGNSLDHVIEMVDQLSKKIRVALEIEASGIPGIAKGIIQTKTNSVEAYKYYVIGRENIYKGYFEEAISNLRKAIQIDSTFAYAYDLLTYVYYILGEHSLAKEAIKKAINISKNLPRVDQLKILLRDAQIKGDWTSELEYLKQLVVLQPDEAEWHFKLGWHFSTHKRSYEQSIFEYKKAIEIAPVPQPRFYYYLGFAYLNWGKRGEAIRALRTYVSLQPEEARSHNALGSAYLLIGDYEKAHNEFEIALKLKPSFSETWANLGDLYLEEGRSKEALRNYERFLASAVAKNQQKFGHYYLGSFYFEIGNLEKAIEEIKKTIVLDKEMLESYWILGLIEVEKGQLNSAKLMLEKMEKILKESRTQYQKELLHHLKGKIYQKEKRYGLAIDEFKYALNLGPLDKAFYYDALAEVYHKKWDLDKAIETYNRVFEFNPNYARSHYRLGRVYEDKYNSKEAIKEYEKFLEIWQDADEEMPLLKKAQNKINILKKQLITNK